MRLITKLLVLLALPLSLSLLGATGSAHAQGKKRGKAPAAASSGKSKGTRSKGKSTGSRKADKGKKEQRFVFSGLDVEGELRAPQLLYFLDRANEELKRASLERRSFIPEMVRSIDEEAM